MRFADTNILLYSVSTAPGEEAKAAVAKSLLGEKDLVLSVEVLQEFYVQATRPSRRNPLPHSIAVELIEKWRRFHIQETTLDIMTAAFEAKERWEISYWDAAIIEAARASGCRELLSEDLADGQSYGGVRVINPFRCLE
ncbi:MAG: PIN domain-containing protein [Chthoniobacterales bacterium]